MPRCRCPGAGNLYPADAALSLPAPRHSHTLARLAALEAARGSFETAHAAITSRCGPVIGKRQIEQAVVAAAADIAAFYATRIPVPCTAPALLVISADAKGVVMRPGALRPDAAVLTASQRNGADTCVRYLTSKQEFLRYDQALAAGWPIATGVIEGACRHLIGDRLDITGARWGLDGAEAILTLRAVISNGDFDEYWHFHLAREHQRLYPGTTQGQYTLGA